MSLRTVSVSLFVSLLLSCTFQPAITLDSLVAKHAQMRGGAAAIERIESVRLDIDIVEPRFAVRAKYVATRSGFARIDIYADEQRVFTEVLTPDGGWQWAPGDGVSDLTEDGRNALERARAGNLYGLHEMSKIGYQLSLIGSVTMDGKSYWALNQKSPDGNLKRLYIDPKEWLVVREQEVNPLHPDIDPAEIEQETAYSQFVAHEGVLTAHRTEKRNRKTGDVIQTTTITKMETNIDVNPALFERPK